MMAQKIIASRFRTFLRAVAVMLLCPFAITACRANEIPVGDKSKVDGYIDVPLNKLETFNFLTRDQILGLRSFNVMKTPQLLSTAYQPSQAVFAQIEDNKPWWGMHGAFIYGTGSRSTEGPSEESRFLMNPFLLVALAPWTAEIWNLDKLSDEDANNPTFPFCWNPVDLKFSPKGKDVQITYDVSGFEKTLKTWEPKLKDTARNKDFGLIAYNARDFGYEYIYVPVEQSTNITNVANTTEPASIDQYIHCGGTCGCDGGCNNMSPGRPPFDHFRFKELPATVKTLLWKQKPASRETPPDMTVTITLK